MPQAPGKNAQRLLMGLALVSLVACKHMPDEREQRGAEIHYDLGVQAQQNGDIPGAVREFRMALELNEGFAEAHNAYALLLHLSFHNDEEAIQHYKRALEIRPTFSEAKVNLANVYLSEDKYDDAIRLYQDVLNDMLYATPFIAQGNLGWALYKKGDVQGGIDNIKAAVTTNPKFCAGYRNLAIIQDERGAHDIACEQYQHYHDSCPDAPDGSLHAAACFARAGKLDDARKVLTDCAQKGPDGPAKEQCRTQLDALSRGSPQKGNP